MHEPTSTSKHTCANMLVVQIFSHSHSVSLSLHLSLSLPPPPPLSLSLSLSSLIREEGGVGREPVTLAPASRPRQLRNLEARSRAAAPVSESAVEQDGSQANFHFKAYFRNYAAYACCTSFLPPPLSVALFLSLSLSSLKSQQNKDKIREEGGVGREPVALAPASRPRLLRNLKARSRAAAPVSESAVEQDGSQTSTSKNSFATMEVVPAFSFSFSLPHSRWLSVRLSLTHTHSRSLALSVSLSVCLSFSVSLSLSLSLSLCLSLSHL